MEVKTVFCEICHRAVYSLFEDDELIEVVQNGKTVIKTKVGSNLNINLQCPAGHSNHLKIGKAVAKE